jgi:hypothetical protein
MTYHSIYDKIHEKLKGNWSIDDDPTLYKDHTLYEGSVKDTLDDLSSKLSHKLSTKDLIDITLHPVRILNGILEYQILENVDCMHTINEVINITSKVYNYSQPRPLLSKQFQQLQKRMGEKYLGLLEKYVQQQFDIVTWNKSKPILSEKTASLISSLYVGKDILFIALANGGVSPGLDIYLRFTKGEVSDSVFYPMRFSRRKSGDISPHLSNTEKEYLHQQSASREVVLFDEDFSTGETIVIARDFIKKALKKDVKAYSNSGIVNF